MTRTGFAILAVGALAVLTPLAVPLSADDDPAWQTGVDQRLDSLESFQAQADQRLDYLEALTSGPQEPMAVAGGTYLTECLDSAESVQLRWLTIGGQRVQVVVRAPAHGRRTWRLQLVRAGCIGRSKR